MTASPTCFCVKCEAARFARWADAVRVLAPLKEDPDDWGDSPMDGKRGELIVEIHGSVAERFPLGIAERLYEVISALHVGRDQDAARTLDDMADDENESLGQDPATDDCLSPEGQQASLGDCPHDVDQQSIVLLNGSCIYCYRDLGERLQKERDIARDSLRRTSEQMRLAQETMQGEIDELKDRIKELGG